MNASVLYSPSDFTSRDGKSTIIHINGWKNETWIKVTSSESAKRTVGQETFSREERDNGFHSPRLSFVLTRVPA